MELKDYPRPNNDTGIGIHWSAGYPLQIGAGKVRDVWIPELKALGVKWLKIAVADGGQELARICLENDIMPIIRLYRNEPNPGTLDAKSLSLVDDYLKIGAKYFEFNNEPDYDIEWQGRKLPPNGLDLVAQDALADMRTILAKGGCPAVPALTVGGRWDIVGRMIQLGGRDIFEGPVWQAVHNYPVNHPLDYPSDDVNQRGTPLSQAEFDAIAQDTWDIPAWAGRTLAQVNAERLRGKNPGKTILDDASCFRSYEFFDSMVRTAIGRSIPVLSTEGGAVVGEGQDARYPATTPQIHRDKTVEQCRMMMANSQRFPPAPDYYFCTCFWLLGNYVLGSTSSWWENAAWYGSRWTRNSEHLPAVDALKALAKQPRPLTAGGTPPPTGNPPILILPVPPTQPPPAIPPPPTTLPPVKTPPPAASGWSSTVSDLGSGPGFSIVVVNVEGKPGLPVRLWTEGWSGLTQVTGSKPERGPTALEFAPLGGGTYTVEPQGLGVRAQVTVQGGRTIKVDFLPAATQPTPASASRVSGQVTNGAGSPLVLTAAQGNTVSATAGSDGRYSFANLPAGTYRLAVHGTAVAQDGIALDGRNSVHVNLSLPAPASGWTYDVKDAGATGGFIVIRVSVDGKVGLPVHLYTAGWTGLTQLTGSKTEYGPAALEFSPLGAGDYTVEPQDIGLKAQIHASPGRALFIQFHAAAPVSLPPPTTPPSSPPAPPPVVQKTVPLFLLVLRPPAAPADLLATLRYATRFAPAVGDDPGAALVREAARIIILGDTSVLAADVERSLQDGGARTYRVDRDIAATLDALVSAGQPVPLGRTVIPVVTAIRALIPPGQL